MSNSSFLHAICLEYLQSLHSCPLARTFCFAVFLHIFILTQLVPVTKDHPTCNCMCGLADRSLNASTLTAGKWFIMTFVSCLLFFFSMRDDACLASRPTCSILASRSIHVIFTRHDWLDKPWVLQSIRQVSSSFFRLMIKWKNNWLHDGLPVDVNRPYGLQ